MLHKESKRLFVVPTRCSVCEKYLPIVIKQGIHCQVCKKNFHVECYKKLDDGNCDVELFWKGALSYTLGTRAKVHTHFWQLSKHSVCIYKTKELKKKLFEIPLNKIKEFINDDVAKAVYTSSKEYQFVRCKFHFKASKMLHFHCGLKTASKTSIDAADSFYEIFELVLNLKHALVVPKLSERKLEEDFVKCEDHMLGSGSFGKVFSGICRTTGRGVAIKSVVSNRSYQSEIVIQSNLNHQGIVQLIALYRENRQIYFVMERLETNLIDYILKQSQKRLAEDQTKFIAYQVFNALNFMHERNIAHCDLKPDNILLAESCQYPLVKICDFGQSKLITANSFRRSKIGTEHYNPPEVLECRPYNLSVDIWAMGVIIYACLVGVMPFSNTEPINEQINDEDLFSEYLWHNISHLAIDLVKCYLLQVSNKRPKTWRILQHTWFTQDKELGRQLESLEERMGSKWLYITKRPY